jgi:hypothetical protein
MIIILYILNFFLHLIEVGFEFALICHALAVI